MGFLILSCCSTPALLRLRPSKHFKLFSGLHSVNAHLVNGNRSDLAFVRLDSKVPSSENGVSRIKATWISGEDDPLSDTNDKNVAIGEDLVADESVGIEAITSNGFAVNGEFDLDSPTEGFASIPEAIEDIREGKMVVVVDNEDREHEGDLIMAAQLATPDAMAFIVKHGTGIVCVSMKEEDLERLKLPLIVDSKDNAAKLRTAFTVTVDANHGTTTGVSAHDRATTNVYKQ